MNLIQTPEIIDVIKQVNNSNDLLMHLSLFTDEKIIPKKTVIFFDEIQECKEIVTKIKFLVDEGMFKYILSGSLLGIELKNIKSAPVGYLHSIKMYPLSFEEYLQIYNITDEMLDNIKMCYQKEQSVSEVIHKRLLEIFNQYLVVGGMPQTVEKFKETHNIDDVMAEHVDIIERYKDDFTKYETENKKLVLSNIYNLIPAELNSKNKRFNFKSVKDNFVYDRNKDNFLGLNNAGVTIPVYNVTEPMIPLILNEKNSLFKLFISDVGLLTTMFGKETKRMILNGKDINNGAIYENVVSQEMLTNGFKLYYYSSKKYGEVDFVVEYKNNVLPIEVKSGKEYTKHCALNNILNISNYGIKEGIVFCNNNVERKGQIKYLPIYMIMFLKNNDPLDIVIDMTKYDLNNLSISKE